MKKSVITIGIISLVGAAILVGVLVWGIRYQPAEKEIVCTDELDTRCWPIYRNEEMGFQLNYPPGWWPDTRFMGDQDGTSWNSTIDFKGKYYVGMSHSYLNYDNATKEEKIVFIDKHKDYIKKLINVPGIIVIDRVKDGSLVPTAIISTGRYIVVFNYQLLDIDYIDEYKKNEILFYKMMDSIQIIE